MFITQSEYIRSLSCELSSKIMNTHKSPHKHAHIKSCPDFPVASPWLFSRPNFHLSNNKYLSVDFNTQTTHKTQCPFHAGFSTFELILRIASPSDEIRFNPLSVEDRPHSRRLVNIYQVTHVVREKLLSSTFTCLKLDSSFR